MNIQKLSSNTNIWQGKKYIRTFTNFFLYAARTLKLIVIELQQSAVT